MLKNEKIFSGFFFQRKTKTHSKGTDFVSIKGAKIRGKNYVHGGVGSKQFRIPSVFFLFVCFWGGGFLPVNEQMDKHQGLRLMRYGSESEGYQPVKPLFYFFLPFHVEKEVLQSNLRTVRLPHKHARTHAYS